MFKIWSFQSVLGHNSSCHCPKVKSEDGTPLLWHCARVGLVNEKIANDTRLRGQIGLGWKATLPLEETFKRETLKRSSFDGCVAILKAIKECDNEVKALNLGKLLLMCEREKPRVGKLLDATSDYYLTLEDAMGIGLGTRWGGVHNWQEAVKDATRTKGTLLQLAVKFNVERVIKFLLNQQGGSNGLDPHAIAGEGEEQRSPAVIAANHGYHSILKLFTNRPVDISQRDERSGRNMLHLLFDRENVDHYKGHYPDDVSYAECVKVLTRDCGNRVERDILRKEINFRNSIQLKNNWLSFGLKTHFSFGLKNHFSFGGSFIISMRASAVLINGSLLVLIFPDVEDKFPINFWIRGLRML